MPFAVELCLRRRRRPAKGVGLPRSWGRATCDRIVSSRVWHPAGTLSAFSHLGRAQTAGPGAAEKKFGGRPAGDLIVEIAIMLPLRCDGFDDDGKKPS